MTKTTQRPHRRKGRPRTASTLSGLLAALLAASGVLVTVGLGPAVVAGATSNGQFSIFPVSTSRIGGRTVFTPVLTAGVPLKDTVAIVNETTAAITLQLYASDAFTTKTGGFGVAANYKPKHTMGAWIHLPVSRVTIPAKSGDVVPFTYDPPAGVAPGDYTGAIVAEQTSGPVNKQGTLHIQTLDAVGVAVYGRIRGKLVPRLAVTRVSVDTSTSFGSAFGGPVAATVHYSVTNTGNENLKPLLTISVSPLVGSAHKVQVQLPRILAGSTVSLSYRVPSAVPFGALTATVTARAFNASDSGSSGAVVMPWGVVGVLILIAAGLFIRARRRRRRPNKGDPAGSGQPGVGARQSVLA